MTTPYLYSTYIHLILSHDVVLPVSHAQNAHAAFLTWMRQVAPEVAAWLHSDQQRKPFTVSPLFNLPPPKHKMHHLYAGHQLGLRLTLVHYELFEVFGKGFWLQEKRPHMRIGPAHLEVAGAYTTPGSHPWAGACNAAQLVQQAKPEAKICLEFYTPTSFKDSGKDGDEALMIELRPNFVFGNLATAWHRLGLSSALDLSELERWRNRFAENVIVSRMHNVNTHSWQIEGKPAIGTTGQYEYEVRKNARQQTDLMLTLNVLADAAFYLGVGRKTTMGMGQTRRLTGRLYDE